MSIAASAVSIWTQGLQLATVHDPQWVRTWPERLATAGDAVWFYLGKLLWPHPLIVNYPRWQIDAWRWVSYLPLLAVIGILSIFRLKRKPWCRVCFLAFTYFITALLPILGLIDNPIFRFSLVFDHFQYLASMGALALAGAGLARLSDFILLEKPWLQSALCAGLLLILGTVTWQRTWAYESQEALWSDTLTDNPNCWAGHNNLGLVFFRRGQAEEAIKHFQKALEINPNYAEAHSNLGAALGRKGQVDEAVEQFRKALEINPNYVEAHSNLGLALFQKGQMQEAVAQYQKALEINPNSFEGHANLGNAFFTKGQLDEAVTQYEKAAEIDPNYFAGHYNLGLAFFRKGQLDEAVIQFRETLRLKPDFGPAKVQLAQAQALVRQGDGHK
ncbi:MAG: tetratricopeptide repeat protein [Verrucomicrobia bacterium]|nr:tetratricopeptide repeat protein [Verrucomicrobiota bacterium]